MTKYVDDIGLEHFFDNIKDLTRGPSYQQVASYLNAHPESLNDPVADYLDENPTATIPDESITTVKLADSSITSVKIADSAVTTAKIVNGAITANKLASDAIPTMSTTTPGIAKVGAGLTMNNGAVELNADTTGISGAVDAWLDEHPEATTTVQDGSISTVKLADGAVTDAKLAQTGGVLEKVTSLSESVDGTSTVGKNKFNPTNITSHASLDTSTGAVISVTPNSSVTEKIAVGDATHVIASYTNSQGNQSVITASTMQLVFYSDSDTVISYVEANGSADIPTGCSYLRATIPNSYATGLARVMIEFGTTMTPLEPYEEVLSGGLNERVTTLESRINAIDGSHDLISGIFDGTVSQIKLIGDSITQGVGGTGFNPNNSPATDYSDNSTYYGDGAVTCIDQRSNATIKFRVNDSGKCWANSFKEYMADKYGVTVKNYGTRGLAAPNMFNHGYTDDNNVYHSLIEQLIEDDDDFVICMFGTNDRGYDANIAPYDLSVFRTYMQQIIDYVEGLGKQIIIMSSLPASLSAETVSGIVGHMEDIDSSVVYLANKNTIQYVSLFKGTSDYLRNSGEQLSSILSDTLHPNDTGYDLLYRLVLEGLGFGAPIPDATWIE